MRILEPGHEADPAREHAFAPLLLRLPGQWVVRKPPPRRAPSATSAAEEARLAARLARHTNAVKPALRCCVNGWEDSLPVRCAAVVDRRVHGNLTRKCKVHKALPGESFYTRCRPARPNLGQQTCALPAGRSECVMRFACRTPAAPRAGA